MNFDSNKLELYLDADKLDNAIEYFDIYHAYIDGTIYNVEYADESCTRILPLTQKKKKSFYFYYRPDRLDNRKKHFIDLWIKSPNRKCYSEVCMNFNRIGHYDEIFNLFHGFRYSDIQQNADSIDFFTDHLKSILDNKYDFMLKWMAFILKFPDKKLHIAPILLGPYSYWSLDNLNDDREYILRILRLLLHTYYADSEMPKKYLKHKILIGKTDLNRANMRGYYSKINMQNYIFIAKDNLNYMDKTFIPIRCKYIERSEEYYIEFNNKLKDEQILANIYHFLINIDVEDF